MPGYEKAILEAIKPPELKPTACILVLSILNPNEESSNLSNIAF